MKKILFLILIATSFAFNGNAQTQVQNNTNCEVSVTVRCYDLCVWGITNGPYTVSPAGIGNVKDCNLGSSSAVSTIYEVCVSDATNCNPPDCVFVVGPGNGNTCGLTIGSSLTNCPDCSQFGGTMNVTYTGTQIIVN